jgi:hypothetical protein
MDGWTLNHYEEHLAAHGNRPPTSKAIGTRAVGDDRKDSA